MNYKSNKGFTLNDIIVAIFIFIIFSGIIISISYNIYLNSSYVKRNSQATNYIVEVFEYAKTISIDENTIDENTIDENLVANLVDYINKKNIDNPKEKIFAKKEIYSEQSLPESNYSYTMFINLNQENLKEEQRTFLKQIDITVMYKLGTKTKTVSMSTLINR